MTIQPLFDYVLVRRVEEERVSDGGIVLPTDITKEKSSIGHVLAIGSGATNQKTGVLKTPSVNVGDKILFGRFAGIEVKVDGEMLLMIKEDNIIGNFDGTSGDFITTDEGEKLYPIRDYVIFTFCANLTKSTFQPISKGGIIISDKDDYDEHTLPQWVQIHALGPEVQSEDLRNAKYAMLEAQMWTAKVRLNGPYGEHLWRTEEQHVIFVSDEYYNPYSY